MAGMGGLLSALLNAPGTKPNDPLEAINRALGPGRDRFEALGSDTLQQWMSDNAVEERDGTYYQRRKLESGEMTLVEVSSSAEALVTEDV